MQEGIPVSKLEREDIINHNLAQMNGRMLELLTFESLGGSSGDTQTDSGGIYICATANGYMNKEGIMTVWGNLQNIPEEISSTQKGFGLEVSFNRDMTVHKITEVTDKDDMGEDLLSILNECVNKYNSKYTHP